MDGRRPIILKAIPKTSIMVKFRRSSCLYPSIAEGDVSSAAGYTKRNVKYPEQQRHLGQRAPDWAPLNLSWPLLSVKSLPAKTCCGTISNARNVRRKRSSNGQDCKRIRGSGPWLRWTAPPLHSEARAGGTTLQIHLDLSTFRDKKQAGSGRSCIFAV